MTGLSGFSFIAPFILFALLALPAIWYLLRLTPPKPNRIILPTIRFLRNADTPPPKPLRSPLWLLLLRLLTFTLLILAFAQPVIRHSNLVGQEETVLIIHDDYYLAGIDWSQRMDLLDGLLQDATLNNGRVLYIDGNEDTDRVNFSVMPNLPSDIRLALQNAAPRPVDINYDLYFERLDNAAQHRIDRIIWLTDPFHAKDKERFAAQLADIAPVNVMLFKPLQPIPLLYNIRLEQRQSNQSRLFLEIGFQKTDDQPAPETIMASLLNRSGQVLHTSQLENPQRFDPKQQALELFIDIPHDILGDVHAVRLGQQAHAAGIFVNQGNWLRPPVGLVSTLSQSNEQPFLSETYYLRRALQNHAEILQGDISDLLQNQNLSILIWPDIYPLAPAQQAELKEWIGAGNIMIQFASNHPDVYRRNADLLPVRLRAANRSLEGALSWDQPQPIIDWGSSLSPFQGLEIPDDVHIQKQIMAVPDISLSNKSWATLKDGTPLVTARQIDRGWTILFHVTPTASWSNLPLSGVFEQMFQRLVTLNQQRGFTDAVVTDQNYRLTQKITGFGQIQHINDRNAQNVTIQFRRDTKPSHKTPAGLYQSAMSTIALNLGSHVHSRYEMNFNALQVKIIDPSFQRNFIFYPYLLLLALLLIILDLCLMALRKKMHRLNSAIILIIICAFFVPKNSHADTITADQNLIEFSIATHLAYIKTGDTTFDQITEQGLQSLAEEITRRTSTQIGGIYGLDIEGTTLALFPMIYWRLHPTEPPRITDNFRRQLNDFLDHGGMLLIDTASGNLESNNLQIISQLTNLPAIYPIDEDHVLGRTFYLLNNFSGYYNSDAFWVSRDEQNRHDGVSNLLVGANNWALAWARDDQGNPRFNLTERTPRQREMAYRFGINLILYSLTGNYKGDQVHIPFILERIGQE